MKGIKQMQEFKFHCPHCGQPIAADDSFCDQIVECPHCSNGIVVPPIQPPQKAQNISEVPRKTEQSTRKRWSKRNWLVAICCTLAMASAFVCLCFLSIRRNAVADNPANSFGYVKGKLAIIAFSKGQGSGFIMKQATKKYLVTNEHVIRSGNGDEPRVMMLNGNVLKLGNCEISRDRDLMRFEVDPNIEALSLADEIPEIGDAVTIYGNSDGGGVSTQIAGKVLGVGGDRLEVSALFVNGNSGSPVIDNHGFVVGVATYLTNYTNANDWVKKDTRFNGIRRFATRLVDMPWFPIDWDDYSRQIKEFNDFELFLRSLRPYLLAYYYDIEDDVLAYSEVDRLGYNSSSHGLHNTMMAVSKSYRQLMQDSTEWERVSKGKNRLQDYLKGKETDERVSVMKEYDAITLDKLATVVERLFAFNQCLRDALIAGQKMLQKSKITIPLLKNGLDGGAGVEGYYKAIDFFLVELGERFSSCPTIIDYASKLIADDRANDRDLGLILLKHIAKNGNHEAIKKIIELHEKQFNKDLLNEYVRDEQMQSWIKAGFKEGKKNLGLYLGELSYRKMQYKDAEMYWKEAAVSGVNDAWVRLGKFHGFQPEYGGGPESMHNIEAARNEFKLAYESGELSDAQRLGAQYYRDFCLRYPLSKDDIRKAVDISSALINLDPQDAYNYLRLGCAIYILEHGHCTGNWKMYIQKAADLGLPLAQKCLTNNSILYEQYKNAMKKMRMEIGGIGVIFLRKEGFPNVKGEMHFCEVVKGYKIGESVYYGIYQIGNKNGMIDVRNYSWEDAASLLRGDVGTEIFIRAYPISYTIDGRLCDDLPELFKLKRVPIVTDNAGVY